MCVECYPRTPLSLCPRLASLSTSRPAATLDGNLSGAARARHRRGNPQSARRCDRWRAAPLRLPCRERQGRGRWGHGGGLHEPLPLPLPLLPWWQPRGGGLRQHGGRRRRRCDRWHAQRRDLRHKGVVQRAPAERRRVPRRLPPRRVCVEAVLRPSGAGEVGGGRPEGGGRGVGSRRRCLSAHKNTRSLARELPQLLVHVANFRMSAFPGRASIGRAPATCWLRGLWQLQP